MKFMKTEPIKRIVAFLSNLFDAEDQVARFEFERDLHASARTAQMRTWEYRNERFQIVKN